MQNLETMEGRFGYFQSKWEAELVLDSLCGDIKALGIFVGERRKLIGNSERKEGKGLISGSKTIRGRDE